MYEVLIICTKTGVYQYSAQLQLLAGTDNIDEVYYNCIHNFHSEARLSQT